MAVLRPVLHEIYSAPLLALEAEGLERVLLFAEIHKVHFRGRTGQLAVFNFLN